jgi:regulator of cell morphogenesis and NO signaling
MSPTHATAFAEPLPADLAAAQVAQLAREHPGTIRVFQRHRIDFCCGGKRHVAEAAERAGLDAGRLVAELAQALGERAGAGLDRLPDSCADLGKWIVGRYHVALRAELPRLVAMGDRVEKVHGAEMPEILPPLAAHVRALAAELGEHMREEEESLFPAIERVERAAARQEPVDAADLAALVAAREDEHAAAGERLRALRELSTDFTPPEWACNTFRGLFHGLAELERELHEHIHLENNVLFPRALELARSLPA